MATPIAEMMKKSMTRSCNPRMMMTRMLTWLMNLWKAAGKSLGRKSKAPQASRGAAGN
jgi:hypothetical protein